MRVCRSFHGIPAGRKCAAYTGCCGLFSPLLLFVEFCRFLSNWICCIAAHFLIYCRQTKQIYEAGDDGMDMPKLLIADSNEEFRQCLFETLSAHYCIKTCKDGNKHWSCCVPSVRLFWCWIWFCRNSMASLYCKEPWKKAWSLRCW